MGSNRQALRHGYRPQHVLHVTRVPEVRSRPMQVQVGHHHHQQQHHRHHCSNARCGPTNHISPCLKCLLFSFNFIFWLCGALIGSLGLWILTEKKKNIRDALDVVFDPTVLTCATGCIIFSVGFFGCLGALRENICLLKTFHAILTVLLLLELLLGIVVFIFYFLPRARQEFGFLEPRQTLSQAIVRYRDDDDLRDMIDVIQKEFQCCGISNSDQGYQDWQANMYFNCSNVNPSVERCGVPFSCCKINEQEMVNVMCGFDTTDKDISQVRQKIYVRGCLKGFGLWLERNTLIVGIACFVIVIPQIVGIWLARTLVEQINLQRAQWLRQ